MKEVKKNKGAVKEETKEQAAQVKHGKEKTVKRHGSRKTL